jgi:hypothetical protein
MGNALSPFIANFFMGYLENKLKWKKLFPKLWMRYTDDVYVVVHKDQVEDLLEYTHEVEQDGTLPFLDVEVKGLPKLNTQRFIIKEFNHSIHHKMATFNSMMLWAMNNPMVKEDFYAVS